MDPYIALEQQMVPFAALRTIPVLPNNEPVIRLRPKIPNGYLPPMTGQEKTLGPEIIVRKQVADKLMHVQHRLQQTMPTLELYVAFGYRTSEFQLLRFQERLCSVIRLDWTDDPLLLFEKTHRMVAVPSVAGHPTGGAVDVLLRHVASKTFLEFGSDIYDYTTKQHYTFAPGIPPVQKQYRLLLRRLMMEQHFAPFDGEWWHFSYGDREWAWYYKQPYAFYDQLPCRNVLEILQ